MSTVLGAVASRAFRPPEGSASPGKQFIVEGAQQPLLASSSVPCPRSHKMLRGTEAGAQIQVCQGQRSLT